MKVDKLVLSKLVSVFEKRGFIVEIFDSKNDVLKYILNSIDISNTLGFGGSQTIKEIELTKTLYENGNSFENRDGRNISNDEKHSIQKRMMNADYYFCSSNAISVDGSIVNIDHSGNRVAAMLYGPKNVFLVIGINKICSTEEKAILRAKTVAGPLNAQRNKEKYHPPCIETGVCTDCDFDERICCSTVIIKKSYPKNRIRLLIVKEKMGF